MASIAALDHRDAGAVIRRLAVPNILALLGDQLLGIVDTIAIGALGTAALASITAATSLFIIFGIGLFAFASGMRIVGAQAIGAGESERFGLIVRSAMIAPLAITLIVIAASAVAGRPLLGAMLPHGIDPGPAAWYLVLRCTSLLAIVVSGQLIAAWSTAGDSSLALRVLLVINAVHVPLVFVLALGVGTGRAFGLAGAGTSSLLAEIVGVTYAIWQTRRRPQYGITASLRIDGALARQTMRLSWPEFVFLILQIAPEPATITLLAPAGASAVGAFRALSLVSDATWSVPGSLGEASQVVLGQRIGASDYAGARTFARSARRIGVAACTLVGVTVAAAAWPLAALVTLSPRLAGLAAVPLAVHVLVTLPLKGYAMTTLAPIRAAGDTRFVMYMGIATSAFALGGIGTGVTVLHLGLWSVPFGWTLAWIVRGTITTLRLNTGDWERRRLAA